MCENKKFFHGVIHMYLETLRVIYAIVSGLILRIIPETETFINSVYKTMV